MRKIMYAHVRDAQMSSALFHRCSLTSDFAIECVPIPERYWFPPHSALWWNSKLSLHPNNTHSNSVRPCHTLVSLPQTSQWVMWLRPRVSHPNRIEKPWPGSSRFYPLCVFSHFMLEFDLVATRETNDSMQFISQWKIPRISSFGHHRKRP